MPEARSLIDAGKVKRLAVMADKRAALYPNLPTIKAGDGQQLEDGGMARHRGAEGPAEGRRATSWPRAIQKGVRQQGVQGLPDAARFRRDYGRPDDFAKYMAKSDADMGATMKAVGIAK